MRKSKQLCFVLILSQIFGTPINASTENTLLASVTKDEQRAWIKVECIAGTAPGEIARRLNAILGSQAFAESTVYQYCREFRSGERVESVCQRSQGRPRTATSQATIDRLLNLIVEYDGGRTEELAIQLNVSESSILRMLHDLGYRYVVSRWVPHQLTDHQRWVRVETAKHNIQRYQREPRFMSRIIAIDETWLPQYMPLTDQQAAQWVPPGENP